MQHDSLLALLCDANGVIRKLLRNTLSLDHYPAEGTAFRAVLDGSHDKKAAHFLQCAREQGACADWELMVRAEGKLSPLRFAAACDEAHCLIVAGARSAAAQFARDLAAGAEGEPEALRPLARRLAAGLASSPLEENGRLDPEFLNLQRKSACTNEALQSLVRELTEELRRRMQLDTERQQAEEALHQLSGQLLKVQEEERRRIARDLHDSTAQKLAALLLSLGLLEDAAADLPEHARKLVAECQAAAEDCAQDIRNLSHLLHPPLLDELGLEAALDTYVAGFAQRSGIHASLDIDPDLGGLSQEAGLALFRVVQESLANVLRHSGSASVSVQLARVRERLLLEVTDQGHGLAPAVLEQVRQSRPGLGVGLMGMRERLRQLRGTLEIESSAEGTTIRAIVPLQTTAS